MSWEAHFKMDFYEWILVMKGAGDRAAIETRKVVGQGCNNIKKEWKIRWRGYAHIPHLPKCITYDVDEKATTLITGVVGPQRGAGVAGGLQWELGSIIEYGLLYRGQNAPIPGGLPALDMEEPRFVRAMAEMGIGLLTRYAGRSFLPLTRNTGFDD